MGSYKTATFHNFQYAYCSNAHNEYDAVELDKGDAVNPYQQGQTTGWQFIPNQRMDDWILPYQWYRLGTSGRAWRIKSLKCTVQNMIPLTEQVAIQGNATFSSFNNTIYALAYDDKLYDTPYNINVTAELPLQFREGLNPVTKARMQLPNYKWVAFDTFPDHRTLNALRWDPFQHPEHLMELRPGKNAIVFTWERSPEDDGKWITMENKVNGSIGGRNRQYQGAPTNKYNNVDNRHMSAQGKVNLADDADETAALNQIAADPQFYFSTQNYQEELLTPGVTASSWYIQHFNRLMKSGCPVADKTNNYLAILQYLQNVGFKKPIPNWFIKLVPLFNAQNALVQTEAQIGIHKEITFEIAGFEQSNVPYLHQTDVLPYHYYSTAYTEQNAYPMITNWHMMRNAPTILPTQASIGLPQGGAFP